MYAVTVIKHDSIHPSAVFRTLFRGQSFHTKVSSPQPPTDKALKICEFKTPKLSLRNYHTL